MTVIAPPRLRVSTLEVDPFVDLFGWVEAAVAAGADPSGVLSWVREGEGIVAWGRAAEVTTHGTARFDSAEEWWAQLVSAATVEDEIGQPGSGLLAFGSFAFSPDSARGGTLAVPEVVVGRRDGRCWVTTIEPEGDHVAAPVEAPTPAPAARDRVRPGVELRDGTVPAHRWPEVIRAAIGRIRAGEVEKVVLARDVVAEGSGPLDPVGVLRRLADRYGATWTFAVDGLVGATPEMLVRLQDGRVRSRVLAGTVRRDRTPAPSVTEAHPELEPAHRSDPRLHLVSDEKELEEHAFAVRSVAEALAPHCTALEVPDEPFVLELPDVYHLATDISGQPANGATSLRLAAALHPSAAVCGTPSDVAARLIAEIEGMDRGRYAGPVGWVDADGDGDWGIALRCGQFATDNSSMRLFAGGGIVAASDPDAELAETEAKLAAMRYALDA
ncbi:isochorismate synthase [Ornithinicoccus hortensis]|uniref:isochorismate synthase n=1 Tax=Ornithinicoccus hortensis TaxID=82346 RepID=A0A542YPR4_9MICO|nr:isochorismate synthase [Ornithinicoccus hortensis]TQL49914.1 isochorismate synthase [Ornithinicoccus hortensis]